MPSRAYTSFLRPAPFAYMDPETGVSMPSRAYTSFLHADASEAVVTGELVSMPSQAYTSFLHKISVFSHSITDMCQCPLGLIPHFYKLFIW